jgi:glyoxylase-like metal-dependent hydrolase (beta-lactamase superfamily II)
VKAIALAALAASLIFLNTPHAAAQSKPKPPQTPRLYVFDCGTLTMSAPQLFGFTKEEVGEKQPFAVPCYLVVHPKGTLMWDTGVIPDAQVGSGITQGISTVTRTLRSQLAEIGYKPDDITYLGLFGDGTVIIKYAPGHTPGHQMLFLRLKQSGPILIAGDLYHLPQEITMNRFPSFEFDKDQSAVSRQKTVEFLKETGARLWIEHDLATFTLLKKSPAFYE